jgi:hypothetical protein
MELTIRQATERFEVSETQLRRLLGEGAFPGARRGQACGARQPPWLIPEAELRSAGLQERESADGDRDGERRGHHCLEVDVANTLATVRKMSDELADLRGDLERMRCSFDELRVVVFGARVEPHTGSRHHRSITGAVAALRRLVLVWRAAYTKLVRHLRG